MIAERCIIYISNINSIVIKLGQLKFRLNHMHESANGLISLASIVETIALFSLVVKFLHDTRDEHRNKETELRSYLVWHPGKR